MPIPWLKGRGRWTGVVCLILAQIALLVLFLRIGFWTVVGDSFSKGGALAILCLALAALWLACRILESKAIWWQVLLQALTIASAVVAITLFFQAFPARLDLLVPATIAFAVSIVTGTTYVWLQKRFIP